MSRRLLLSALVLVLALSTIIGFIFIRKKSATVGNPLKIIPIDASFVLKVNNFHNLTKSLTKDSKVWGNLCELETFRELSEKIIYFDSLTQTTEGFSDLHLHTAGYISGHSLGNRTSEFLYILSLSMGEKESMYVYKLNKILSQNIKKSSRSYEGRTIYNFKTSEEYGSSDVYLTVIDGNIAISRSGILIENSIRQFGLSNSLIDDIEFTSALSTAGKSKDANLLVDLSKFISMTSTMVSDDFYMNYKNYKNLGGWAEFDINPTEGQIILNGFIFAGIDKNSLIGIFKNSKPVTITVDKVLPSSTSVFLSVGIENIVNMSRGLTQYLSDLGRSAAQNNELKKINDNYDLNMEELFKSLIDDQIAVAHSVVNDTSNKQSIFVIVKCKSGNMAQKELHDALTQVCEKEGKKIEKQLTTYSFDNETKFDIVEFPVENITGTLFGGLFSTAGNSFYTIYENYLVFGESVEALSYLLYNNVLNRTLSTNEVYKSFKNNIAQQSYILLYTNLIRSADVFKPHLSDNVNKAWQQNTSVFEKVQPLGIQLTEVSSMQYCNFMVRYISELETKPFTTWESLLDTSFNSKPQFLINHNSKENEIFLQDLNNTIYLINKEGRIIWKQKIEETINSRIYQIDYFKNGKLQILFSTENYIHLIDREGNYVERYPVRLRAASSAGLSLFDYEENKDYRIFIPCVDRKIYAYAQDGSLISGWQFEGSDYPINQPINHFRIGDKDYIVFGDKYHTYILDRKGAVRLPVNALIPKSRNNEYILDHTGSNEKARILITDSLGRIVSIYFDGRVSTQIVGKFSANHFFDFKDMDADGESDFIFLDGSKLSIFRQDHSKIFSYQFRHLIKEKPVYFRFSSTDRKLGLVDNEEQKIYLMNSNGSIYKGFPLTGTTLFSIGYLNASVGAFDLIVGGKNNFLYNYSVQ